MIALPLTPATIKTIKDVSKGGGMVFLIVGLIYLHVLRQEDAARYDKLEAKYDMLQVDLRRVDAKTFKLQRDFINKYSTQLERNTNTMAEFILISKIKNPSYDTPDDPDADPDY